MEPSNRPALSDFLKASREALGYLKDFGFIEVSPPANRYQNPYEIWFKADDRFVVVAGEGWGDFGSIRLEHSKGVELQEIYLVPEEKRPGSLSKKRNAPGQLDQIRNAAERLRQHGGDFLEGNLERFFKLAKPLPPYRRR